MTADAGEVRAPRRASLSWTSSISQGWSSATESLLSHRLRSALTLVGIMVGTAAVLAITVFGQLTQQAVAREFGPLGATMVSITPQPPPLPPQAAGGGNVRVTNTSGMHLPSLPAPLDDSDLQALRGLPHVVAAALHDGNLPPIQAIAGGQNTQAHVIGATPDMQSVLGYPLASGAFFTDQDETARANVIVIGATLARTLFPGQDAVGQSIQLNNVPCTVSGVFAPQGTTGEFNLDQLGIVPYSVMDRLRGNARIFLMSQTNPIANTGALVQVDDVAHLPQVEAAATQLIQQRHPPKPDEQPYIAADFTQAVQVAGQSTQVVRLALSGVAALTLLLGAFGLFSMMTLGVTERTREIGVRMAVGARTRDVLAQFLIEAALLGLLGGVAGAALGCLASSLVPRLMTSLAGGSALPSATSVGGVLVGALVLGIVFGVVPARRAANLDPATALRRT